MNQRWLTRYGVNSTPALLDVMMCSKRSHLIYFNQLCLGGITDHDLLLYVYKLNLKIVPMGPVYFRDFIYINMNARHIECNVVNWTRCCLFADVNNKLEYLIKNVLYLFNKYVPLTKIINRKDNTPWYNRDVKLCIQNRNMHYREWKSCP